MAAPPLPAWPRRRFGDFCLTDFSKFVENWRLILYTIITHDKIELCIVPVFVLVRFMFIDLAPKNRTRLEDAVRDSSL